MGIFPVIPVIIIWPVWRLIAIISWRSCYFVDIIAIIPSFPSSPYEKDDEIPTASAIHESRHFIRHVAVSAHYPRQPRYQRWLSGTHHAAATHPLNWLLIRPAQPRHGHPDTGCGTVTQFWHQCSLINNIQKIRVVQDNDNGQYSWSSLLIKQPRLAHKVS